MSFSHGIRKLKRWAKKFDPNFHQAIYEVPLRKRPPGIVMQEIAAGLTLCERCLSLPWLRFQGRRLEHVAGVQRFDAPEAAHHMDGLWANSETGDICRFGDSVSARLKPRPSMWWAASGASKR